LIASFYVIKAIALGGESVRLNRIDGKRERGIVAAREGEVPRQGGLD
jgi:hypothetical protein